MKKYIENYLVNEFGNTAGVKIYKDALNQLDKLNNNAEYKSNNQKKYLENSIFPAIVVYRALQHAGLSKEAAYDHMKKMIGDNTKNSTRKMWTTLGKLPFFFPLFKALFSKGLEGDSWDVLWIANDKATFEYHIQRCLWHDTFKKYGCAELCAIFCHNDEINFTNVSKHMDFKRNSALGYGGDCCAFCFSSTKK